MSAESSEPAPKGRLPAIHAVLRAAAPWPQVIAVSGPSGSGKETLIKRLLSKHPDRFMRSISHTTRDPRPGERDGRDYHFVTVPEFECYIKCGAFVEHTIVAGHHYGTSWRSMETGQADGRTLVLGVNMSGIRALRQSGKIPMRCAFVRSSSASMLRARSSVEAKEEAEEKAKTPNRKSFHPRLPRSRLMTCKAHGDTDVCNKDMEKAYEQFESWAIANL